ncbi:ChrR family anti-sigma-E factor [Thalassotalea sp. PLHSN55]|uniref:ChrR family anti-sigma-E factor n=1 Tax=Thalassotalea sp. PLHSN55 TaxID=3435888 RepID=UPI003F82C601
MIKHHPKLALIQSFVDGELPASLSAGIAIHADMCPVCQEKIAQLTEQMASASFEQAFLHTFAVEDGDDIAQVAEPDFEQMLAEITESDQQDAVVAKPLKQVSLGGEQYTLPKALTHVELAGSANIGKLTRARCQLNEGEIHSSLLHISPGGSVPEHTHKGFELTVLLAGSFSDDSGEYVAGDFIMLDGNHTHHPVSEKGCLCFTVANDALHFTQGINKLLNPIGSFIY